MSLTRRLFVGALPAFVALRELRSVEAKRRFRLQRWPAKEPIIVESRMGPEWDDAVAFTVASWRRIFPRLRYRVLHRPNRPCGMARGRIVLCVGGAPSQASGSAWVNVRRRQAIGAVVRVNEFHLWEPLWSAERSMIEMATLCHEFGHALGLDHNDEPDASCVAETSTRITPGPFDRESLRLLYRRKGRRWP